MNLVLISLGGALGSLLRYGCSQWWNATRFPFGTLAVNLGGSFLIGMLFALFSQSADESKRLFFITGFCGGFTTFSAFSLESLQMLQQAKFASFFLYTFASILFGIMATLVGFKLFTA